MTGLGSLALLLVTAPAFPAFFFGENFLYLGMYRSHHNHFWSAFFSPSDIIFFRPVFFAASLPWHFLLPQDPFAFHLRNFAFTLLNVVLLHRLLLSLISSPRARIVAILLFLFSKVHLTVIGYINIFDSTVFLLLLLLTLLLFLRHLRTEQTRDFVLACLTFSLAVFSKDYGLVILAPVLALLYAEGGRDFRRLTTHAIPLIAIVAGYLALRHQIVGPLPSSNPIYSPRLSAVVAGSKVLLFGSTLCNVSLHPDSVAGAAGLGSLAARLSPTWANGSAAIERLFFVGFVGILIVTVVQGRRAGWKLLLPLTWIAACVGPSLLIRNSQLYYFYEGIAGVALLLAICLDSLPRFLQRVWIALVGLIGIGGVYSNYGSYNTWQYLSDIVGEVATPLQRIYRDRPVDAITFVTRPKARAMWQFALTADGKGPLLPELLQKPDLRLSFSDRETLSRSEVQEDALHVVVDVDQRRIRPAGARGLHLAAMTPARSYPSPLLLRRVDPPRLRAGKPFNVQADGQSALSLECMNATPDSVVVFGGVPLATAYGSSTWLTAIVPADLFSQPGRYRITLRRGTEESNSIEVIVEP